MEKHVAKQSLKVEHVPDPLKCFGPFLRIYSLSTNRCYSSTTVGLALISSNYLKVFGHPVAILQVGNTTCSFCSLQACFLYNWDFIHIVDGPSGGRGKDFPGFFNGLDSTKKHFELVHVSQALLSLKLSTSISGKSALLGCALAYLK